MLGGLYWDHPGYGNFHISVDTIDGSSSYGPCNSRTRHTHPEKFLALADPSCQGTSGHTVKGLGYRVPGILVHFEHGMLAHFAVITGESSEMELYKNPRRNLYSLCSLAHSLSQVPET